jgi:N-acetylglucosaminyldiphosphoundecaprenol N-acetyl-beta-D-mannosaminyltransferase
MEANMAPRSVPAHIAIHGIDLVNLGLDEAVDAIVSAVETRQPTKVAFVNADCANIAARDPAYRAALEGTDWVFVDGSGMRIAGEILHQPVRDNVNGTDLFPRLCEALAGKNHRVFLLGARPGIAEAVGRWMHLRYPGVTLAGSYHGYFRPSELPGLLQMIRAARPDVLLVAFGAPMQEQWINQHMNSTGATVVIGVGGLFDYYSGRIPRAPRWMRQSGLEWLFRLIQEPGRLWRRYLVGNLVFLARTGLARLRLARTPPQT